MPAARNASHQDLHEGFGISRCTAWAYHQTWSPSEALGAGAEDRLAVPVAGTLVPAVHWRHRSDLASGKRRRHRVDVSACWSTCRPAPGRQPRVSGQPA